MKKPIFSIVVPAYNEENYIGCCLNSLVNQDFPNDQYEIIVVDNASTDKTSQIAKNFGVKVIKEQKKGVVFARQKGTLAAKGKIIISFDADSQASPDWLVKIYQNFKNNPSAIAVAGYFWLPEIPLASKLYYEIFIRSLLFLSAKIQDHPFLISASNFAFKKSAFMKAGGYPLEAGRLADQLAFLGRLKKNGKIIFDSHLMITTSARRTQGRFITSVVIDGLTYTFLDPLFYKLTDNHLPGKAPDIR